MWHLSKPARVVKDDDLTLQDHELPAKSMTWGELQIHTQIHIPSYQFVSFWIFVGHSVINKKYDCLIDHEWIF